MRRWVELGRGVIPGGGELRLKQRDAEFSIMVGTTQLMNSRHFGSEEALATLTCDRLRGRTSPAILIGGLGMGFTLRAALTVMPPSTRITVVELVPTVIAWALGPLAELHAGSLDDPRVTLVEGDVATVIAAADAAYDAILLDVDNGPEGLTHTANDRLYGIDGLEAARRALRPDGILAVWSSTTNGPFDKRLRRCGFRAERIRIGAGGSNSFIWFITPGEASQQAPLRPPQSASERRRRRSRGRG